jgi:hypothetical protein
MIPDQIGQDTHIARPTSPLRPSEIGTSSGGHPPENVWASSALDEALSAAGSARPDGPRDEVIIVTAPA